MSVSELFIRRPIATALLTVGLAFVGIVAFFLLPVSPLPNVDLPTISVTASMPGASPETMSSSVATPLERHLGTIADVTEMTSSSSVGNTRITLQFGLDRDIDGAARDVQAAINAARADLPTAVDEKWEPRHQAFHEALIAACQSKVLLGFCSQLYARANRYFIRQTIDLGGETQKVDADVNLFALTAGGSSQAVVTTYLWDTSCDEATVVSSPARIDSIRYNHPTCTRQSQRDGRGGTTDSFEYSVDR